jgi:hypothetical protein
MGLIFFEDDYLFLLPAADLRMDPALRPRPVSSAARISWQLLCSYQSEICFCSCLSILLTTGSQCTVLTQ